MKVRGEREYQNEMAQGVGMPSRAILGPPAFNAPNPVNCADQDEVAETLS
jgi:hypothetical protein